MQYDGRSTAVQLRISADSAVCVDRRKYGHMDKWFLHPAELHNSSLKDDLMCRVLILCAVACIIVVAQAFVIAVWHSKRLAPPAALWRASQVPQEHMTLSPQVLSVGVLLAPTSSKDPWHYRVSSLSSTGFGIRHIQYFELAFTRRPIRLQDPAANPPSRLRASTVEIGWPFYSASGGWVEQAFVNHQSLYRAVGLLSWDATTHGHENAIGMPVRPIWHGALLNVAVFTCLEMAIVTLYLKAKQSRRIRRGCCRYCGYRVLDETRTCPECGVPAR